MQKRAMSGLVAVFFILSCVLICARSFTKKDDGREVNVPIDDIFEIQLAGNPTTGYRWENVSEKSDAVEQIGEPEYEATGKNMIGSGGVFIFKFKAKSAGSAVLNFIYHRSFEKDVPPVETFEMKIVVGMMGQILDE